MTMFRDGYWKIFTLVFVAWFLAFYGLIRLIGVEPDLVLSLNPVYFALGLMVFFLGLFIYAISWAFLLRSCGEYPRFVTVLKSMMIGLFVSKILPAMSPGEMTMGYVAHKEDGLDLMNSLASVTAQMFSWGIGFGLTALIVVFWVLSTAHISSFVLLGVLFMLIIFMLIISLLGLFLFEPEAVRGVIKFFTFRVVRFVKWLGFLKHKSLGGIERVLDSYLDSFRESAKPFLRRKKVIVLSSLIMVLYHMLIGLTFYFVAVGLGIQTYASLLFLFFVVSLLISWISFVPGGIGVFEVSSVSLVSTIASPSLALMAVAIFRLIYYWFKVFLGGLLAIEYEVEGFVRSSGSESREVDLTDF